MPYVPFHRSAFIKLYVCICVCCRIIIANADFALVRGDVENALTILKEVKMDNPYYIQAIEKMAWIYLKKK